MFCLLSILLKSDVWYTSPVDFSFNLGSRFDKISINFLVFSSAIVSLFKLFSPSNIFFRFSSYWSDLINTSKALLITISPLKTMLFTKSELKVTTLLIVSLNSIDGSSLIPNVFKNDKLLFFSIAKAMVDFPVPFIPYFIFYLFFSTEISPSFILLQFLILMYINLSSFI